MMETAEMVETAETVETMDFSFAIQSQAISSKMQ